ncbi:MAG: HIT domain-containing protein [Prolixibacteraceae bacterium]|nr:HIT domain-containing protein [Prolixibacteraceae bacterium]
MAECPFCNIEPNRLIEKSKLSIAFYDKFPVSIGHVLIVPKRHEPNNLELTNEEKLDIEELKNSVIYFLKMKFSPDGFNIGVNIGKAAGQTISHCHIHITPRYEGDIKDPIGGVRGVIPHKQKN